jgi:hypothetical protein
MLSAMTRTTLEGAANLTHAHAAAAATVGARRCMVGWCRLNL